MECKKEAAEPGLNNSESGSDSSLDELQKTILFMCEPQIQSGAEQPTRKHLDSEKNLKNKSSVYGLSPIKTSTMQYTFSTPDFTGVEKGLLLTSTPNLKLDFSKRKLEEFDASDKISTPNVKMLKATETKGDTSDMSKSDLKEGTLVEAAPEPSLEDLLLDVSSLCNVQLNQSKSEDRNGNKINAQNISKIKVDDIIEISTKAAKTESSELLESKKHDASAATIGSFHDEGSVENSEHNDLGRFNNVSLSRYFSDTDVEEEDLFHSEDILGLETYIWTEDEGELTLLEENEETPNDVEKSASKIFPDEADQTICQKSLNDAEKSRDDTKLSEDDGKKDKEMKAMLDDKLNTSQQVITMACENEVDVLKPESSFKILKVITDALKEAENVDRLSEAVQPEVGNQMMKEVRAKWNGSGLWSQDVNLTSATYLKKASGKKGKLVKGLLEGEHKSSLQIIGSCLDKNRKCSSSLMSKQHFLDRLQGSDETDNLESLISNVQDLRHHVEREQKLSVEKIMREKQTQVNKIESDHRIQFLALQMQQNMEISRLRQMNRVNPDMFCYQKMQLDFEHSMQKEQLLKYKKVQLMELKNVVQVKISKIKKDSNCLLEQLSNVLRQVKQLRMKTPGSSMRVTVELRKDPCKSNRWRHTFVPVVLPVDVAVAILMEDKIYSDVYTY